MRVLVATNNPGKLDRVRGLLVATHVEFLSPKELDIPAIETDEGSDIVENAGRKARAYFGTTEFPILGMDSAFVIAGENLDPAKVRRNALVGRDESSMSREDVARVMTDFYRSIAERNGGRAAAYWEDVFVLLSPDGTSRHERSMRPVFLTSDVREPVDPNFPLRSMYIVGPTGKYTADQTPEEGRIELKPYADALCRVLGL